MEAYPGEIDDVKATKALPAGAAEFERNCAVIASGIDRRDAEIESLRVELAEKKKTIEELTAKLADSETRWAAEHSRAESLAMWRDTVMRAAQGPGVNSGA